jgi:hypothetical protein
VQIDKVLKIEDIDETQKAKILKKYQILAEQLKIIDNLKDFCH